MQPVEATTLPWICRAASSHCAALVSTNECTGPGSCPHPPTSFLLVRYPDRSTWCAFLCAVHARQVAPLAEPLDEIAAAELADRRTQHALGMAGKQFRRPVPLQVR
jgi:hypothetical protein